jgi:hypothetical protein
MSASGAAAVRTVTVKNPDGSTTQYTMLCAQTGSNNQACRFGTEGAEPNPYFPALTNATVSNIGIAIGLALLLWLFLWPDDDAAAK